MRKEETLTIVPSRSSKSGSESASALASRGFCVAVAVSSEECSARGGDGCGGSAIFYRVMKYVVLLPSVGMSLLVQIAGWMESYCRWSKSSYQREDVRDSRTNR